MIKNIFFFLNKWRFCFAPPPNGVKLQFAWCFAYLRLTRLSATGITLYHGTVCLYRMVMCIFYLCRGRKRLRLWPLRSCSTVLQPVSHWFWDITSWQTLLHGTPVRPCFEQDNAMSWKWQIQGYFYTCTWLRQELQFQKKYIVQIYCVCVCVCVCVRVVSYLSCVCLVSCLSYVYVLHLVWFCARPACLAKLCQTLMDTHASRWIGLVSVSDFHSDESTKSQWLLSEYSAAVWSGWRVQVADSVQIVAVSVLNESLPAAAQTAHRTHIAQYQKDTHRTVSRGHTSHCIVQQWKTRLKPGDRHTVWWLSLGRGPVLPCLPYMCLTTSSSIYKKENNLIILLPTPNSTPPSPHPCP